MQVTKQGVNVVLKHRKALLQLLAREHAPARCDVLKSIQRDYVRLVGGERFENIVKQLAVDDCGMPEVADIVAGSMLL